MSRKIFLNKKTKKVKVKEVKYMIKQSEQMSQDQDKKRSLKEKKKKKRAMSAGFISLTLLLGIISFAICFIIGIMVGPNLPI